MRKNVAGQNVAGQMNDRTTGAPLTSGVSVFVTGDNGTQNAGGGTTTHKGNGQWNYAPTQAETNFNHIAFVFTHSTGVHQTVNVYTVSYDPHDTVRLGLTALPNAAANSAGGVPVIGTGTNQFKSDASANVTFANTSIGTATNVTTVNGLAANVITAASINAAALNGKGDWNIGKTGYSLTAVTGLGNQTANITGNLSGSVGSVTADVGITQAGADKVWGTTTRQLTATQVFNNTGTWTGNLTGSVGSVTGAVTVGTINANVIDAASIAAGALNGKGDWNIGKTDYSILAADKDVLVDLVWDEVLTAATHNVNNSSGKRLRLIESGSTAFSGNITGTPSATVLKLDGTASSTDNFYRPGLAVIESSFGVQFGRIASYVGGTTKEITLATALATVPNSGDAITILPWASVRVSEIDTDVIDAASLAASAGNKIADHTLRRTYANARQSANGDAANFRSLLGAVGKLVNRWNISGNTLTVFQEDDLTSTAPGGTQVVTGTAGADPITQLDTN